MLSVEWILTILFATHTNILTSHKSTVPYRTTSALWERSPTPCTNVHRHSFGFVLEPR